jgi:hypothetical protein
MAHLFTFASSRFDPASEKPNPFNPIAGEALLNWLRAQLDPRQFAISEPDAEDWGWYVNVRTGQRSYLLGASGGEQGAPTEWTVQLHLDRSVWDKLSGANKLAPDDALSTTIEAALRENHEFRNVEVERDA